MLSRSYLEPCLTDISLDPENESEGSLPLLGPEQIDQTVQRDRPITALLSRAGQARRKSSPLQNLFSTHSLGRMGVRKTSDSTLVDVRISGVWCELHAGLDWRIPQLIG